MGNRSSCQLKHFKVTEGPGQEQLTLTKTFEKINPMTLSHFIFETYGDVNEPAREVDLVKIEARKLIQEAMAKLGDQLPYDSKRCELSICVPGCSLVLRTKRPASYKFDLLMKPDPNDPDKKVPLKALVQVHLEWCMFDR